jgi:flagellar hook assembly protein FlgD
MYTIVAGELSTWVEIDLNGLTIPDDVTQQLLYGVIQPAATGYGLGIMSLALSAVDGDLYFVERTQRNPAVDVLVRWDGERQHRFEQWPDGTSSEEYDLVEASSDGSVFIAQDTTASGGIGRYLLRQPELVPEAIPSPCSTLSWGGDSAMSPDGSWILTTCCTRPQPGAPSVLTEVVLQSTSDPALVQSLPPPVPDARCPGDVRWDPDGSRAVIAPDQFNWQYWIVAVEDPPTLDMVSAQATFPGCQAGQAGHMERGNGIDFERNLLILSCDLDLKAMDLSSGEVVDSGVLATTYPDPYVYPPEYESVRYGGTARAAFVRTEEVPVKSDHGPSKAELPSLIQDWRRGITRYLDGWWGIPGTEGWLVSGSLSSHDQYAFMTYTDHANYATPTANLSAHVNPVLLFGNAGIELILTVTDKNLDLYQLEYAAASCPDTWYPLGQPVREPMLGDSWGTWLPPAAGRWAIRVTAVDLAANRRSSTAWISWNGVSDISGLWRESRYISPLASPGVQDQLIWHYTVLRPANLLFEIADADGAVLRQIAVAASSPGEMTTTWDGTDDSGRPVPDGEYELRFRGATWPVIVDNTPPAITVEVGDNALLPRADEIAQAGECDPPVELERDALVTSLIHAVADSNLDRAEWEVFDDASGEWLPLGSLPGSEDIRMESNERPQIIPAEWWREQRLRRVVTDHAGNRSVAERQHREEELLFTVSEPACRGADEPCVYPDRPQIDELVDEGGLLSETGHLLYPDYSTLLIQSTVWGDLRSSLRLELRTPEAQGLPPGEWQPGTLTIAAQDIGRRPERAVISDPSCFKKRWPLQASLTPVYWEHQGLPVRPYEIRLVANNRDGDEIVSPIALVVPLAPLTIEYLGADGTGDHFRIHNIGSVHLSEIAMHTSADQLAWQRFPLGLELGPGEWSNLTVGCLLYDSGLYGGSVRWVRVTGIDSQLVESSSLVTRFLRPAPPAISVPNLAFIPADCLSGAAQAQGIRPLHSDPDRPPSNRWFFDRGWHSPGNLAELQITVPGIDPSGLEIAGYELLIDGNVAAGAPELVPGGTGSVVLDLSGLSEGSHELRERYLFAGGATGLLSGCARSTSLVVDRAPPAFAITAPAPDERLCPDGGQYQIGTDPDVTDPTLRLSSTVQVDGSGDGVSGFAINVPALSPGGHELEVMVQDEAGNASCDAVGFATEAVAAIEHLGAEPGLFSPVNLTGRPTETAVSLGATAAGDYRIEIRDSWGWPVQIAEGRFDEPGETTYMWNGRDLGGELVEDGTCTILGRLESDCGAVVERDAEVVVDATPPSLVITEPWPWTEVGATLQIKGSIEDPHLELWQAWVCAGEDCDSGWELIGEGNSSRPGPDTPILQWSTDGKAPGPYNLRITAVDRPGNESEVVVPFEIHEHGLIRTYELDPMLFSPNGDGQLDSTVVRFELLRQCEVRVEVEDTRILISDQLLGPGVHSLEWDGTDEDGVIVADGSYDIFLRADDASGSGLGSEVESLTAVVDHTPPVVTIPEPVDGALLGLPVQVQMSALDLHPGTWALTLTRPDGSEEEIEQGDGNLELSQRSLESLDDGLYQLTLSATDAVAIEAAQVVSFTVDATAPSVIVTTPPVGAILDVTGTGLHLGGVVTANHPDQYSWWMAPGLSPPDDAFVLLEEQPIAVGGTVELVWNGPLDDGPWTARLILIDQLGRDARAERAFVVDSEAPEVAITEPTAGQVLSDALSIRGTVADANLAGWRLRAIAAGGEVLPLAEGQTPVAGVLSFWNELPPDGLYTLELEADDRAGHTSVVSVPVEVAVALPGAPLLTAAVVNQRDVDLSWQPGPGTTPIGYDVYRDGQLLNAAPIDTTSYLDLQLEEGSYSYYVIALGSFGRVSDPSNTESVVINFRPPEVAISAPAPGQRVAGEVEILGTAYAELDFAVYGLFVRPAGASDWTLIHTSTAPVIGGLLGVWNTFAGSWPDGDWETPCATAPRSCARLSSTTRRLIRALSTSRRSLSPSVVTAWSTMSG